MSKTKYTETLADEICDRLANGESLERICKDEHMPSSNVIRAWKRKHEAFLVNYGRAREDQGDYYGQKVQDVSNQVLSGEVAPDVARVAMDGFKWTAARMNRAVYGDKQTIESTVTNVNLTPDEVSTAELLKIATKSVK